MPETNYPVEGAIAQSQLPALPQSAVRLLKISQDPDIGPAEFAAPIEADIGLTSQILRFVNSSYFGFAREIGSIRHAVALVGIRSIKNFALWNAVFSLIPDPKCGPFHLKSLWQDSLRRALFGRLVGTSMKLDTVEDLFAAMLLQDMSLPILANHYKNEYEELFEERNGGKKRLSDLELEKFGWSHATVGALLAKKWGLPANFGDLITNHIRSVDDPELGKNPNYMIMALGAKLPAAKDCQWFECDSFTRAYESFASSSLPAVPELLARIDEEFEEFAPLLNLPTATRTLTDSLESAREEAVS